MKVPTILEEQAPIIEWAKEMMSKYYSLSTVILYLTKDVKDLTKNSSLNQTGKEKLLEVRNLYNKYNSHHKDAVLTAIMLESYRKENDIKEGQIVTNGMVVGYAYSFDLHNRTFHLFSSKEKQFALGRFNIDDFTKVGGKSC